MNDYDVIIIGGSYSGLAAAMALGRSLRKVLVIDANDPCNKQTPYSHNFITQDGKKPSEISSIARKQVEFYESISFLNSNAIRGEKNERGFVIYTSDGKSHEGKKIILATGLRDILPEINGIAECWGISVLHCPYCHGFEARNERTGIIGNGEQGFEFTKLISNWTKNLTLFTNATSKLTVEQTERLSRNNINVVEKQIEKIEHTNGLMHKMVFNDKSNLSMKFLYAPSPFEQHSSIPKLLGCEFTDEGYIKTDTLQKTSVAGVYACGDNSSRIRSVANAVATGTTAGIMLNKEMVMENF